MSDQPLLLNVLLCRDFGFTRDTRLTETAAISIKKIVGFHIPTSNREEVLITSVLILTGFRDRPNGASGYTLPADPVRKKEAVFMMIRIRSRGGYNRNLGNNGACPHCLAYGRDKTITKAKGPQA